MSVIKIKDASHFASLVQKTPILFVKVYAEWCGHCKVIKKVIEDLAVTLSKQSSECVVVEIHGPDHNDLVRELDVKGFPTLFVVHNQDRHDYNGERNLDAMLKFISTFDS